MTIAKLISEVASNYAVPQKTAATPPLPSLIILRCDRAVIDLDYENSIGVEYQAIPHKWKDNMDQWILVVCAWRPIVPSDLEGGHGE